MKDSRTHRLAANFANDMDAVAILNATEPFLDSTYWYLTQCTSGTFEGARAVVMKDGTLHMFVSTMEEEGVKESEGYVHVYNTDDERKKQMKHVLEGCKRVGVNYGSATYSSVEWMRSLLDSDVTIVDASNAISATTAIKDETEIESIRRACDISSEVARRLPELLSEGVTEREVATEIDMMMLRLGGSGAAFGTIVAFGEHSSEPHYSPRDHALRKGDVVLFDFGSKYGRYCSDLSRTVFLGDPDPLLRRAYDVVREAQIAGLEEMRDGADASAPDLAARKVIDESEFKGRFIHSYGHGIGMNVHEPIHISHRSKQKLHAGNVVSAEPGIYIPGLGGIRIEDTVLITEDGCRILTDYDHSLTIV